jgi:hypothetical protein
MHVVNKADELVISIPSGLLTVEAVQEFLDYLRYKTIISKSKATEKNVDDITADINASLAIVNQKHINQ